MPTRSKMNSSLSTTTTFPSFANRSEHQGLVAVTESASYRRRAVAERKLRGLAKRHFLRLPSSGLPESRAIGAEPSIIANLCDHDGSASARFLSPPTPLNARFFDHREIYHVILQHISVEPAL
ncbi:hypothetical protein PM082_011309 [Marasmius tenuissimus]|nr:hypothetical protein PM082_011309 [Marasmius tenuissimus]